MPTPILVHIQTTTAVLAMATFAYTRACIAAMLRTEGGHRELIYGGACVQFGACLGGVLGFVLVNDLELFESTHNIMCG